MPITFSPLIPARLTNPKRLRYPLYLSPKVDGVRCSLHPQLGPVTRAGNRIQNPYVRKILLEPQLHGLDGEIAVGPPNTPEVLGKTIAAVVLGSRPIDFAFFVFDDFTDPALPFRDRIARAQARVEALNLPWLHILPQWLIQDAPAMLRHYNEFLAHGFEGGVLRAPEGRYRSGRATEASRLAIKIKPAETIAKHRAMIEAKVRRRLAVDRLQ